MPLIPLFSVFWISVLAWFLLVTGLERRLAVAHPQVHAGLRTGAALPLGRELAVLRFLCTGRDRLLADAGVGRRCHLLRLLLVIYTAFFLVAPALLAR